MLKQIPYLCLLVVGLAHAEAPKVVAPTKPPAMAPKFSCAVTPNAKGDSKVTIKKIGGGPTSADKDVVAIVNLPKSKSDTKVCGSALVKEGSEAFASISIPVEPKFPYTCEASQTSTTFACNPVK